MCILQWSIISLLLWGLNKYYNKKLHEHYKILDDPDPPVHRPVFPVHQPVPPATAAPPPDDLPTYEEATKSPVTLNSRLGFEFSRIFNLTRRLQV